LGRLCGDMRAFFWGGFAFEDDPFEPPTSGFFFFGFGDLDFPFDADRDLAPLPLLPPRLFFERLSQLFKSTQAPL